MFAEMSILDMVKEKDRILEEQKRLRPSPLIKPVLTAGTSWNLSDRLETNASKRWVILPPHVATLGAGVTVEEWVKQNYPNATILEKDLIIGTRTNPRQPRVLISIPIKTSAEKVKPYDTYVAEARAKADVRKDATDSNIAETARKIKDEREKKSVKVEVQFDLPASAGLTVQSKNIWIKQNYPMGREIKSTVISKIVTTEAGEVSKPDHWRVWLSLPRGQVLEKKLTPIKAGDIGGSMAGVGVGLLVAGPVGAIVGGIAGLMLLKRKPKTAKEIEQEGE